MNIKISWNKKTKKDCFGIGGEKNTDHIWPISKGGSNHPLNKLTISEEANMLKSDKTKGKIKDFKFAVRREVSKEGIVYGVMLIKSNKGSDWIRIVEG